MFDRQIWRNFDWPLFIAVLMLCCVSAGMIYSATNNTVDLTDYWLRQAVFTVMGVIALLIIAAIDYRHLEILAPPAFLIFVASLIAVALWGTDQDTNSRRWLNIGGTLVQPTESGKFLLVVFLAWYLSWYQDASRRLPYLIGALVFLLGPLVLIYEQPDLGTTIIFAFIGGALILAAGVQYWQLGLIAGIGLAAAPFLWNSLHGYMQTRIDIFLDPNSNPAEAYNVDQALIAIGSGGWMGQGWAHGSQNQLHFLRVRHTDFLFSVMAEELGFIGCLIVLLLLFFVIWRLLNIADKAQDQFGRLLAVGVAAIIFFQTVVNAGMNLNLMPVTGITLPFISYGGSSLVSMMFAIGLAQSVVMRHRKIEFL